MQQSPEEFGPLTPEQFEELVNHPFSGTPLYEIEEMNKWNQDVIANSPQGDPARRRSIRHLEAGQRYYALKSRFDDYGMSEVVDLTEGFGSLRQLLAEQVKLTGSDVVGHESFYKTITVPFTEAEQPPE